MSEDVTVVLSGYKRSYATLEQYQAIKNQTVKDIKIMFWINFPDNKTNFPEEVISNCQSIISASNYGVWGRFIESLHAQTEYVCIIDDDTIPGERWIENCINTIKTHEGVLATRGVIINENKKFMYPFDGSYKPLGWCGPHNTEPTRVDMGCHNWFFRRLWLRAFFAEMPAKFPMNFGEDMHLSASIKLHYGFNTYVPPHPESDKTLWGSCPKRGGEYGQDKNAISHNGLANLGMNKYWEYLVKQRGYKTIGESW